jgi:hypothetical protein
LSALKRGVSQGSILGLGQFVLYINDLSLRINSSLKPTVFADNTSVIIFSKYYDDSSRAGVFNLSDSVGHINNFNDARGPQSYT